MNHLSAMQVELPPGIAGVKKTLQMMVDIIRAHRTNPNLVLFARKLVQDLPQKDFVGEVKVIHEFVRDYICYVKDVRSVETLQLPERTIEIEQGDCDDKTILSATLLEALGHRTRIVAVAIGGNPSYSHVLAQVLLKGKWVWVECTEPVRLEWQPQNVTKQLVVLV